jgi:pimeloyl-ACP methyl ester carboxylesterase
MIEAVVQAGSFETAYRRAGRGGTVLLLLAGEDQELGDWLFATLGERFRTIAPDLPADLEATPSLLGAWLCALIDGLGLEEPAVVAGLAHAHALLRFAARDPDRVGRLVLLQGDEEEKPVETEAALAGQVQAARRPVRVVAVPRPEDHAGRSVALEGIVGFLSMPA